MKLALFDLDETLLCGDSDNAWHDLLLAEKLVDPDGHREKKQHYYQQYLQYQLDINEYLDFSMAYLRGKTPDQLTPLQQKIVAYIAPMIWQHTSALLDAHRRAGFELVIITTTNAFISAPIAKHLGAQLIATQPEMLDGVYTGKPTLPIVEGKTKTQVLNQWLSAKNHTLEELEASFFYTDSYNDIGLLERVQTPVVVNGDARLQEHAAYMGWPSFGHDTDEKTLLGNL